MPWRLQVELSKLRAKLTASSEERVVKGGSVKGALSHANAFNDDGTPSDTTIHQLSLTGLEKQSVRLWVVVVQAP